MSGHRCAFPRCRNEVGLIYLGKSICDPHWMKYADRRDLLRKQLNLPAFVKVPVVMKRTPRKARVPA